MKRILLIDDQQNFCEQIQKALNLYKTPLEYETEAKKGLERVIFEQWDVVLLDVVLNQSQDGLDILKQIVEKKPYLPIIMVSGTSTLQTAVEATKMGAYDFLVKPINPDELKITVRNALANQTLQEEVDLLKSQLEEKYEFSNIIGKSSAMQQVFKLIEKVTDNDIPVLIIEEAEKLQ